MCTAISFNSQKHYFGRNLDYFHSFGEKIVITPRSFPFQFRKTNTVKNHHAIIGTAFVKNGYPLYYDGANEKGLCIAGLLFSDYAHYHPEKPDCENITPFEFIPWVLSLCETVKDAKELLKNTSLVNIGFDSELGLSPLHWIISDKKSSITVESLKEGLFLYDNPADVLTNSPPFPFQLFNLNNYLSLSAKPPENTFSGKFSLSCYSFGMGALGLPGDFSSMSRFVKASFVLSNSVCQKDEKSSVNHFFRLLDSVAMPEGSVIDKNGNLEKTLYSCCINADEGIYYYSTHSDRTVRSVGMNEAELDSSDIKVSDFL